MFNISPNGIISASRGDTYEALLFLNSSTVSNPQRYILTKASKVYFGLMEPNQLFEDAILKKIYTKDNLNENGDVVIKFMPEDTINLSPGKYYYQIKASLLQQDGTYSISTINDKTLFYIKE